VPAEAAEAAQHTWMSAKGGVVGFAEFTSGRGDNSTHLHRPGFGCLRAVAQALIEQRVNLSGRELAVMRTHRSAHSRNTPQF
jgi:hypothetical protein